MATTTTSIHDTQQVTGQTTTYSNLSPNYTVNGDVYTPGFDYSLGFHVVAVDWSPGSVSHYVDGVLIASRTLNWVKNDGVTAAAPAQFGVGLRIGGAQGGDPSTVSEFPIHLGVNYMRMWSKNAVAPPPPPPIPPPAPPPPTPSPPPAPTPPPPPPPAVNNNLIAVCSTFNGTGWSQFGSTISGALATDPTGLGTAQEVVFPATIASVSLTLPTPLAANTTYTGSIYSKLITGNGTFFLSWYDGSNHFSSAFTAATAWARTPLPFTFTTGTGGATNFAISNFGAAGTAIAGTIALWGLEVEPGSGATTFLGCATAPPTPPPAPPPPVVTNALPVPILFSWLNNTSSSSTLQTFASLLTGAPQYNVATVFVIGPPGDTSGNVNWNSGAWASDSALAADIATWKASVDKKGNHRVALAQVCDSFSGAGSGTFLTTANATACVTALKSLVTRVGVQGVNWDLESGDGNSGTFWNATTINSINAQMRAAIPSWIVSGTPRPFECHPGSIKRGWIGTDDFTIFQYYFGDGGDANFFCAQIQPLQGGTDGNAEGCSQFINGTDGGVAVAAKKIVFGNDAAHAGAENNTACTPAQYVTAFTNLAALFPGLGGAGVWQSDADQSTGYATAKAFGTAMGL